jgi:hypothetical protein
MTHLTDQLAEVNFDSVRLDAIRAELASTRDYTRRIHWWVRLFGIIWIGIPAAMAVLAVAFMVGAMAR